MLGGKRRRDRIGYQALATGVAIPFLFPVVAIISISFQGQGPLVNYSAVISQTPFLRFALNSALISLGTITVVYLCTMLSAYALAKIPFRGASLVFNILIVGLVLPIISLLVPMFVFVERLGLFNSYWAVIIPLSAVVVPFTLLLTRNFMFGIPNEILEAAKIDGANELMILARVVLPIAKPISAVVIIWTLLQAWNEFFLPLVFLQAPQKQAITQVPLYFTSTYGSDTPKIFAALVLICLPIVVAYLSLQKLFERGLTAGAVK